MAPLENGYTFTSQSKERKHIALLYPSMLSPGGIRRVYLNMVDELVKRGYKVDILILKSRLFLFRIPESARLFILKPYPWIVAWRKLIKPVKYQIPASCHVHYFGPSWFRWLAWIRVIIALKLSRRCRALLRYRILDQRVAEISIGLSDYFTREHPDVILVNRYQCKAGALLAKHLIQTTTRIVVCAHGPFGIPPLSPSPEDIKRQHFGRVCFPDANGIIAVSKDLAKEMTTVLGLASDRVTTIYNPVITSEFETLAQEKPDHPWMTVEEPPVILACGRLASQKDYPTLLRAFARLENEHIRLVILGKGKLEMALKALSCELDIAQRVSFAGWVSNPLAFMSRVRLFVLSSRWEGLGNVLIEAMGCGCPVVSTDCVAGPREILEDGRWGELVAVGDDQALAQAIERALAQEPDREALRRRASFFSVDRTVDQYEKVLFPSDTL